MRRSDKKILAGCSSGLGMPKELYEVFKGLSDIEPEDYQRYDRALACCVTKLNELRLEKTFKTKISWRRDLHRWLGVKYEDDPLGNFGIGPTNFLDHSHFRKNEGNVTLVGEPYMIDINTLRDILRFCDRYDLYFYQGWIDPPIHFPNHTIALCFTKKKKI